MDEQTRRDAERLVVINDKYNTGRKNKGGSAYNILSLQYDRNEEGDYLKLRDEDAKVRALMRSNNIDTRANCGYNVVTGDHRKSVEVPHHKVYNPDTFQTIGARILGTDLAGKPVRKEWFQQKAGSA